MRRALAVSLLAILGCKGSKEAPPPTSAPTGSAAGSATGSAGSASAPPRTGGLDLAGMDRDQHPGDDFFAFANGAWLAGTEIPDDRSSWGTGAITNELTTKRVAELIQAAATATPGSEARKVGDYYATYMDEATIESKGFAPVQPILDDIAAIKDAAGLARSIGGALRADVDALNNTDFETDKLFGLWVAQDLADPTKYSPYLLQGGLGMPDRDYYLDASPRMAKLRDSYRAHIVAMLKLAGITEPEARAKRIFELEARIAKAHATRTESADVKNGLTHWSRADFTTKAPGLDWTAMFEAAGLGAQQDFVVWHPKAMTGIAAAVKAAPLATWKEYLAFRALGRAAPFLPKAFADERFAFYGTALSGTPKQRERWKRAVDSTSWALGEAVGKLYVEKYFSAAEKQRAAKMVDNVLAAFGRRIDALAWMKPETKAKAKAKLAVLKVGVGYPDTWTDYSGLQIVAGDALGNAERAGKYELALELGKLGKPVDRTEWVMTPHLVNAVNLPAMNAMNFPAAILQPPYFDPNRPELMDYGAIGSVIGHEISHSFDDQGALFDETGKLANWWTPEDLAHFKESSKKLVAQYNAYKPFPDLAVNGTLTLSENIADVAGLAVAYDAYKLTTANAEPAVWSGMTGDQQFFVSFGQAWRTKYREPALRQRIITDGHAPSEYRADTVRNLDAWYTAFGVKPGEKLYLGPADRVRVW